MPTVLIIDDSMFQRFNVAKILKGLGFATLEASSGAEGLEIIQKSQPDAVFLDLNMPGMNGVETLTAIRATLKDLPVTILTADIQPSTRAKCEEAGATAMINKPASQDQLSTLMGQLFPNA